MSDDFAWRPIASAPKDTLVLIWSPKAREHAEGCFQYEELPVLAKLANVSVSSEDWQWCSDLIEFESGWESTGSYTVRIELKPTHWMPLPRVATAVP